MSELIFDEKVKRHELSKQTGRDPFSYKPRTSIFGMRTASGYAAVDASSAMQKAIRRGFTGDAAYWAIQGHQTGTSDGKHPLRSNLWNRLVVISVEDIGPADLGVQSEVLDLMASYRDDPRAIATAAVLLAEARKSRLTDNLLLLFNFSEQWARKVIQGLGGVENVVNIAYDRYERGMLKKFSVLLNLLRGAGKPKVGKRLAFSILAERLVSGSAVGERLRKQFGSKSELYLLLILMAVMKAASLKFEERPLPHLMELQFDWKVRKGVPEYALDKHSTQKKRFRTKKEATLHFHRVGAKLNNAHPTLREIDEKLVEMIVESVRRDKDDCPSWEYGMTFDDRTIVEALK